MKFANGATVRLGDPVSYHGQLGVIVFSIDDEEYSQEFPKDAWSYLERGVMIRFGNGALLHLSEYDVHLIRIEK